MKKLFKKMLSLFLVIYLSAISSIVVSATYIQVKVPNYMQPNSVLIYDNNLDYSFERGGEIAASDP